MTGQNPPSIGGLPQQLQQGYGPYPGGYNANPGAPLAGGMQPGMQPPGASYGGGNAQMPPQMGQPMTDPRQAGGFFGRPNGFPQGHPGFGNGYFGRQR
jgi:hypothetical protein